MEKLEILNPSETPPFPLDEEGVNEDLRLRYRYLDLRRPAMAQALQARHRAALAIRRYLDEQGSGKWRHRFFLKALLRERGST